MSSSLPKHTEEELRASEARYRTFVDHATDAFMLHAEDGTVIDVNLQACDNLGDSRDELIGMKPMEFDPNVTSDLLEDIDQQLSRGQIVTFESRHRRKDGSEYPVEVRVRPFWHGARRLNISVVRDISDRKQAEQAVRRSERDLRELIETIPVMAFVIGHDGSSQFVSRQWIEFSGMSAEQNTGENWAATLHPDDEMNTSQPKPKLQKNRVSLRTEFAVGLPTVLGDKIQLQQVILNLVVNAIEAMSEVTENQRELCVSSQKIESHSESGQQTIDAKAPSEQGLTSLLIAVRDTGPGLDSMGLKHVFETFYTTKSHGMGMGLAISRSIIEAHNGRLWVTANEPRGAVFQFELPSIPA